MQDKIFIASDHGGYGLKEVLKKYLQDTYDVRDLGTNSAETSVDYPDEAFMLVQALKEDETARGILICTSGIGMSIAANRFPFIRGALVFNPEMARLSRAHNDANVLIFGAKFIPEETAKECVKVFLETPFDGGRHARRVQKLTCGGDR